MAGLVPAIPEAPPRTSSRTSRSLRGPEPAAPLALLFPVRRYQPACKPGSVWRVSPPRRPFIWGAGCPAPRATNPGGGPGNGPRGTDRSARAAAPIWSCSRWGLPCRVRCRPRGALLPHRFTLAAGAEASSGGLFSVALSLGSPPAAVSRHRVSMEPGLSSADIAVRGHRRPQNRQRPSGRLVAEIRAGGRPPSRGAGL